MTLTDLIFFGGILLWLVGGATAVGCLYVLVLMGDTKRYASTRDELDDSPERRRLEALRRISGPRVLP